MRSKLLSCLQSSRSRPVRVDHEPAHERRAAFDLHAHAVVLHVDGARFGVAPLDSQRLGVHGERVVEVGAFDLHGVRGRALQTFGERETSYFARAFIQKVRTGFVNRSAAGIEPEQFEDREFGGQE